jgi:hypothetical protein
LIDPVGQPWSQANYGLVLQMLDEDLRTAMLRDIPGAPGLAGTPTEYGGETFKVAPQPTPVAGTLPPLSPTAPAAPAAPTAPPTANGAPPPVVGRKRGPRVETSPQQLPQLPFDAPEEPAVLGAGVAAGGAVGPPPPPGRPPQRLPTLP